MNSRERSEVVMMISSTATDVRLQPLTRKYKIGGLKNMWHMCLVLYMTATVDKFLKRATFSFFKYRRKDVRFGKR